MRSKYRIICGKRLASNLNLEGPPMRDPVAWKKVNKSTKRIVTANKIKIFVGMGRS